MKIKVVVTEADIAIGQPESPYACPIALALIRNGAEDVEVTDRIECFIDDKFFRSDLPAQAAAFVEAFDDYRAVDPFAFEIEADNGL